MTTVETDIKAFDVAAIRKQFPVLKRKVKGKDLVYFDNSKFSPLSSMSLKPRMKNTEGDFVFRAFESRNFLMLDDFVIAVISSSEKYFEKKKLND